MKTDIFARGYPTRVFIYILCFPYSGWLIKFNYVLMAYPLCVGVYAALVKWQKWHKSNFPSFCLFNTVSIIDDDFCVSILNIFASKLYLIFALFFREFSGGKGAMVWSVKCDHFRRFHNGYFNDEYFIIVSSYPKCTLYKCMLHYSNSKQNKLIRSWNNVWKCARQ